MDEVVAALEVYVGEFGGAAVVGLDGLDELGDVVRPGEVAGDEGYLRLRFRYEPVISAVHGEAQATDELAQFAELVAVAHQAVENVVYVQPLGFVLGFVSGRLAAGCGGADDSRVLLGICVDGLAHAAHRAGHVGRIVRSDEQDVVAADLGHPLKRLVVRHHLRRGREREGPEVIRLHLAELVHQEGRDVLG